METEKQTKQKEGRSSRYLPLEISPSLSELVGAYIGDGCIVYNGRAGMKFELAGHTKLDMKYFLYLKGIIRNIFGCKVKIKNRGNELQLITYSKEMIIPLVKEFDLPIGRKTETTSIPHKIYKHRRLRVLVLRGIFDTDGFVYLDKRKVYKNMYPRLGITTKSKGLGRQITQILEDLGFKNYYTRIDNRHDIFNIELYGFQNLKRWMDLIGSSNRKHIDKINYALVTQSGRHNRP